jgi:hypothetical protein
LTDSIHWRTPPRLPLPGQQDLAVADEVTVVVENGGEYRASADFGFGQPPTSAREATSPDCRGINHLSGRVLEFVESFLCSGLFGAGPDPLGDDQCLAVAVR